jgi:hypothetical protein
MCLCSIPLERIASTNGCAQIRCTEFGMAPIRPAVHILPDVLVPAMTAPTYDAELFTALEPKLDALVEELTWWTTTLRWGRQPSSEPVAAQA